MEVVFGLKGLEVLEVLLVWVLEWRGRVLLVGVLYVYEIGLLGQK